MLRAFAYTFLVGILAVWGFSERLETLSARAERNDLRAQLQLQQLVHDAEMDNAKAIVRVALQDQRIAADYVNQMWARLKKYNSPLADCYTTSYGDSNK
jgi:hypothetical protein